MPPRSYIEAMDRHTVLYILYTMVSVQQTNLLPKNASRNDAIFAQNVYQIYATTLQYLSSYGCAITMVYVYLMFEQSEWQLDVTSFHWLVLAKKTHKIRTCAQPTHTYTDNLHP